MEAGEVALLLTDVEASTRLLVRHGQSGVAALGRVSEVISATAREHGGQVSTAQGEGDSALVLFTSVGAAVAAALELNEWLAAEHWPAGERVLVRSAVHVGEVTTTDEGLFGLEVHRCARLRALADGGEVLLSDAAVRLVAPQLPLRTSVADEGLVLLRGFAQPERVWRLVHPALSPRRRPLVGANDLAGALPEWRTSLVGRSAEVAGIIDRLDAGHIVTLIGPAGVGKTRLAAAAASQAALPVRFIDLTLATSGDDVPAVAAEALGVEESASFVAGIEAALSATPALIVLDNCEHVLDAAALLVDQVSTRCPASSILTTSRAPLRVSGEQVVAVTPLATEPGGAAMQLFLDRARAVRSDLVADDAGLEEVAAVVALLDGVPLAIELAAARLNAFSVRELLGVLRRDLGGLSDPRRRGPDRQRTLRAAIEWSLRLLSDDERAVLCRLAVLPGSFRLATAEAISAGAAAEALPALVDHSLAVTEHRTGPTRYRLLEMVRVVAQEALADQERMEALDRLLDHCIDELAGLAGAVPPPAGLEVELAQDHALHAAAVEHALVAGRTEQGLHLVHRLFELWYGVTQRSTLDRWMDALVAQAAEPSRMRGMVLRRQAIIAADQLGDDERAMRLLAAAEADAIAIADRELLGRVRGTSATTDLNAGRLVRLEPRLWEAVALLEETGTDFVANVLTSLGRLAVRQARFDEAEELFARAMAAAPGWFQRIHLDPERGWCALAAGKIDAAATIAATGLESAEHTGNSDLIAHAIEIAALAAMARGDTEVASELLVRLVAFCREHDLTNLADGLAGLAVVSVLRGDPDVARVCRDELQSGQHPGTADSVPYRRLAAAFVDLADGDKGRAAEIATEVRADAAQLGMPYFHVLGTELLAASIATTDPTGARQLLDAAADERRAVGARAWPLEPYRDAALRNVANCP